jgi:hypothetical protein
VAFASSEEDAQTSELCYTAARILAQQVRGDVALVDASVDSLSLADRFNFAKGDGESQISERLWVVNRSAWIEAGREGAIDTGCVRRLREIASQFDFSIFSCEALNTVTTTLAGACDGLVLVLKANTTRRLVAKRLKEQLRNTDVPLLGTVLIGRRFPIPERIYRML